LYFFTILLKSINIDSRDSNQGTLEQHLVSDCSDEVGYSATLTFNQGCQLVVESASVPGEYTSSNLTTTAAASLSAPSILLATAAFAFLKNFF
jgi:hypothetical protein